MYCKQCELEHPADAGHYSGPALTTETRAPRRRHVPLVKAMAVSQFCSVKGCDACRFRINDRWTIWFHLDYQEGAKTCRPAPYCEVTP